MIKIRKKIINLKNACEDFYVSTIQEYVLLVRFGFLTQYHGGPVGQKPEDTHCLVHILLLTRLHSSPRFTVHWLLCLKKGENLRNLQCISDWTHVEIQCYWMRAIYKLYVLVN